MNYSKEIEAYSEGQMSAVERMAFEHELEDNAALQAEWEAHQLVQDLLDQVATQLSVEDILNIENPVSITQEMVGEAKSNTSMMQRYRSLVLAALLICTCFYYMLEYNAFGNVPKDNLPSQPVVASKNIPIVSKQVQTIDKEQQQQKEQEVFQEYKETPVIKEKATPTVKKVEKSRPIAVVDKPQLVLKSQVNDENTKEVIAQTTKLVNIVLDHPLKKNSKSIYKASESITLAPGFSATEESLFETIQAKKLTPTSSLNTPKSVSVAKNKEGLVAQTTKNVVLNKPLNKGLKPVSVKAEESITLGPGFHATAGVSFKATIGDR